MNIEPFPKRNDWLKQCLCGGAGKPLPVLANALIALNSDPGLRDAIAYDEMLPAPMLMHEIGQPPLANCHPRVCSLTRTSAMYRTICSARA